MKLLVRENLLGQASRPMIHLRTLRQALQLAHNKAVKVAQVRACILLRSDEAIDNNEK